MIIFVPGDPVGKERPRHTRNGHTYTPAKTKVYEEKVKWCFRQAHGTMLNGPVRVRIVAYYRLPKRPTKAQLNGWPTKRPDIDNLAKAIIDAINGLAYHDDAQIVTLCATKKYGEPGVFVEIEEADTIIPAEEE